jgi:hypothetical protein
MDQVAPSDLFVFYWNRKVTTFFQIFIKSYLRKKPLRPKILEPSLPQHMATTKTNLSKIGDKKYFGPKNTKKAIKIPFGSFLGKIFVDSDFALICFGGSHML